MVTKDGRLDVAIKVSGEFSPKLQDSFQEVKVHGRYSAIPLSDLYCGRV
jgi:hypothetical protein